MRPHRLLNTNLIGEIQTLFFQPRILIICLHLSSYFRHGTGVWTQYFHKLCPNYQKQNHKHGPAVLFFTVRALRCVHFISGRRMRYSLLHWYLNARYHAACIENSLNGKWSILARSSTQFVHVALEIPQKMQIAARLYFPRKVWTEKPVWPSYGAYRVPRSHAGLAWHMSV